MSKNNRDTLVNILGTVPIFWLPIYYFLIGPVLSSQSVPNSHMAAIGALISALIGFILVGFLLFRLHISIKIIPIVSILCCILLLLYAWVDYAFYIVF